MRNAIAVFASLLFAVVMGYGLDIQTAPFVPTFCAGAVYGIFARWVLSRFWQ